MSIDYVDYLGFACNEQIMATKAIINPRSITSPEDVTFIYEIRVDEESLNQQAEIFRELFTSKTKYVEVLNRYINIPFDERDKAIEDTYKYSAIKVFNLIRKLKESGMNFYGNVPSHSLAFIGHKKLFYTFMRYNIFTPSKSQMSNLSMTKVLEYSNVNDDVIADIPVYKENVKDGYPGGIFNSTYERILESMTLIDDIKVSDLSSSNDINNTGEFNPLGNMAYNVQNNKLFSATADSIASVRVNNSITDTDSKFWNLATFINIKSIDNIFSNMNAGSPYIYVARKESSSYIRFAEVKSITGINIDYLYSDFGASYPNFGRDIGGPVAPFDGDGRNSPQNGRDQNGDNYGSKRKAPKKQKGNENSNKNNLVNAAKSFSSQLGRALSSEETRAFVASTAQQYFGHRLKKNEINQIAKQMKNSKITSSDQRLNTNLGIASGSSSKKDYYIEDIE